MCFFPTYNIVQKPFLVTTDNFSELLTSEQSLKILPWVIGERKNQQNDEAFSWVPTLQYANNWKFNNGTSTLLSFRRQGINDNSSLNEARQRKVAVDLNVLNARLSKTKFLEEGSAFLIQKTTGIHVNLWNIYALFFLEAKELWRWFFSLTVINLSPCMTNWRVFKFRLMLK